MMVTGKRFFRMLLTVALLTLVLGDLGGAALATPQFALETADQPPLTSVGGHTSIALDPLGTPHIAYHDWSNEDLKFAARINGYWVSELIDSTGTTGRNVSLVFDAIGNPHISYQDVTNENLRYAVRVAGSWYTETIDAPGQIARATSIAVDESGRPHIAYHDYPGVLKYALKSNGSWITEIVDGPDAAVSLALALDAQGDPHIAYMNSVDDSTSALTYANKSSGSWAFVIVDASGFVGQAVSLALDAADNPHISYRDREDGGSLNYAHKQGDDWIVETVTTGGTGPTFTSIALDALGYPHISYYFGSVPGLEYAEKTGVAWATTVVDAGSSSPPWNAGRFNCLAVDAQGSPHISYYIGNGSLGYARGAQVTDVTDSPSGAILPDLHPNRPNPFSRTTKIHYELPQPARVRLAVYDVTGRLVRVLLDDDKEVAGEHEVEWDGRNDLGRHVSPGIYLYQMESGTTTIAGRMVLLP